MSTITSGIEIKTKFTDDSGKIMQVDLKGYLDQSNTGVLEKTIDDIFTSECYNVVFNMEQLHYISSAGWGVFVGEIARFRVEGGDFKLAAMSPEVAQVFMLLEFYHIIEDYPTLESAIESFDNSVSKKKKVNEVKTKKIKVVGNNKNSKVNGFDKNEKAGKPIENSNQNDQVKEDEITGELKTKEGGIGLPAKKSFEKKISRNKKEEDIASILGPDILLPQRALPLKQLSLHEKVRKIAGEYPLSTIWQIQKMLKHEQFGHVKINIFKLYRVLKTLNLETKAKRYRYFRSI